MHARFTKFIILSVFGLLSLRSSLALADWVSGGGHLFQEEENPWFLPNTSTVTYCVTIDESHFGTSLHGAKIAIRNAIAFWKREFSWHGAFEGTLEDQPRVLIPLGTQVFEEVSCEDPVDIIFQLGTLTPAQQQKLKAPHQIIAGAFRTSYDLVNLKASGFIYVSPETGPFALRGVLDFGAQIIPMRWQSYEGDLLYQVLLHELGHVFGIQHRTGTIMDSDYPRQLIDPGYSWRLQGRMPQFFADPREWHGRSYSAQISYPLSQSALPFLGIPQSHPFIRFYQDSSSGGIVIQAATESGAPYQSFGLLQPDQSQVRMPMYDWIYGRIFLPLGQKAILIEDQKEGLSFPLRGYHWGDLESYIYQPLQGGTPRPVLFSRSDDQVVLYATLDASLKAIAVGQCCSKVWEP